MVNGKLKLGKPGLQDTSSSPWDLLIETEEDKQTLQSGLGPRRYYHFLGGEAVHNGWERVVVSNTCITEIASRSPEIGSSSRQEKNRTGQAAASKERWSVQFL